MRSTKCNLHAAPRSRRFPQKYLIIPKTFTFSHRCYQGGSIYPRCRRPRQKEPFRSTYNRVRTDTRHRKSRSGVSSTQWGPTHACPPTQENGECDLTEPSRKSVRQGENHLAARAWRTSPHIGIRTHIYPMTPQQLRLLRAADAPVGISQNRCVPSEVPKGLPGARAASSCG